jgi:alkaline phosphatase D
MAMPDPHDTRSVIRWFEQQRERGLLARRRDLLRAAAGLALGAFAAPALAQAPAPRIRFVADPFTLGVASGYPRPDRVALWTRLAPAPLEADGGMQPENVDVGWEVAADEAFTDVVAKGRQRAVPELAHSVHVEASGLAPGRDYWYRFNAGAAVSPVGRTRTAPAVDADSARLRFAIGSCQNYEHGWFDAYRHVAAENLDLFVFLGDYIYEGGWGNDLVRRHVGTTLTSLSDYRRRHSQYASDPALQIARRAMPWVLTWDDHEVENDYAGDQSEHRDPAFLLRRANAYQAWFEHLPMPLDVLGGGGRMRIHRSLDWGRLARLYLLDDRQYRSPQACPDPYKRGGSTEASVQACAELADPARTLLGAEQERWLDEAFASSRRRWNLIGQQTLLTAFPTPQPDGPPTVWTDGWDGYPAARQRLLDALRRHRVANPVVLGGDLHTTIVGDVLADGTRGAVVAAEFCGTSINAQAWPQDSYASRWETNRHIDHVNARQRGYLSFDLTPARLEVRERVLASEKTPRSDIADGLTWIVEDGRPGVRRA